MYRLLEKAGHPVAIYEVPLLFEKNLQSDMKATILVTASEPTRGRLAEQAAPIGIDDGHPLR